MGAFDAGSMCCCGIETFTVFGPRYLYGGKWDQYDSDLGKSPAHLLGSVYYSESTVHDTAASRDLYTIADNLPDSGNNYPSTTRAGGAGGGWETSVTEPPVTATVTTWGGNTLYVVNAFGALQKVNLPEAESEWWVSPFDDPLAGQETELPGLKTNAGGFKYPPRTRNLEFPVVPGNYEAGESDSPGAAFWYPKYHDTSRQLKPNEMHSWWTDVYTIVNASPVTVFNSVPYVGYGWNQPWGGAWCELGLGLPTGDGRDSECPRCPPGERANSHDLQGAEVVTPCISNVPGEFLQTGLYHRRYEPVNPGISAYREDTIYPWNGYGANIPGYDDDGAGLLAAWVDDTPTDGRVRGFGGLKLQNIDTMAGVNINTTGNATVTIPGDEVQWGYDSRPDAINCAALDGPQLWDLGQTFTPIMTDEDFLTLEGAAGLVAAKIPAKVLPQKVATHDWPYGAGGYKTAELTKESKDVSVYVAAYVGRTEVEEAVQDLKVGGEDMWPPRLTNFGVDADNDGTFESCDFVRTSDDVASWILNNMKPTGDVAGKGFTAFPKNMIEAQLLESGEEVYIGQWKVDSKVGYFKVNAKTHLVTGEIKFEADKLPYISTDSPSDTRVIGDTKYYWVQSTWKMPTKWQVTGANRNSDDPGDWPWGYLLNFDDGGDSLGSDDSWAYMKRNATLKSMGDGIVPDSKYRPMTVRAHILKGNIYFYDRTADGSEVFLIAREDSWDGVKAPRWEKLGGTEGYTATGDITYTKESAANGCGFIKKEYSWYLGDSTETTAADFGTEGFFDTNSGLDRGGVHHMGPWDLDHRDGHHLESVHSRYGRNSAGPGNHEAGVSGPGSGPHYTHSQLWFGDKLIWDEVKSTDYYPQVLLDGTEENINLNAHYPDDPPLYPKLRGDTVVLDSVELLPGNRIAVLTREISLDHGGFEDGPQEHWRAVESPQKLTVFSKSAKLWEVDAVESASKLTAHIAAASDRWLHVTRFPLDVSEATDNEIPAAGQEIEDSGVGFPEKTFTSWLFSIGDGETRVPARVDEPHKVRGIYDTLNTEVEGKVTSSWASGDQRFHTFETTESGLPVDCNYDSPKKSSVIETVKPGTMHPAEFF